MKGLKFTISILVFLMLLTAAGGVVMAQGETGEEDLGQAEVFVQTLNVRSGPGLDNSKIGEVYEYESHPILDKHTNKEESYYQDWVKIELTDDFYHTEGWVSANYVNQSSADKPVSSSNYTPLQGYRITVDPGHGGPWDPGAVGPTGLTEKEVALDVSLRLRNLLENWGGEVYLTRVTDVGVPLWSRIGLANRVGSDMFVSIHANGSYNRGAHGTETYYSIYRSFDYYLAESIQNGLLNNADTIDRGVRHGNFYVLNHAHMPATLVELAFITNHYEESLLRTDSFRQNAAQGIAEGIVNYVN